MPWVFVFALSTKGQSLVFFTPLEITRLVVLNETTLPVAWCSLGLSAEAALDGGLVCAVPATVAASSNAVISRAQSLLFFIGLPPLRRACANHAPERPARQAKSEAAEHLDGWVLEMLQGLAGVPAEEGARRAMYSVT